MARKAKLYILDEPLGGVDPATRDYILDTILRSFDDGASLLISTHLVDELEDVVDDCVFLKEGHLIAAGTKAGTCGERSLRDRYFEIYGQASEGGEGDA